MEGKQGYLKGMDQDSAFTKRDPNSYFSADNFRVVTDEGSSSGSLETEKGTSIAFKIPDLIQMTLTDGTNIPAQANLKIIGSCTMVDELILFTTNDTTTTPSSYGQIWKCKYDEDTGSIIGLTGANELDPAIHLFYNQALNFSTEYRIGRAIALYETSVKQRVYWTDFYNQVRVFNLADPAPLDIPLNTIDLFPGVDMVQPVVESIGVGTLPAQSKVEFTYKLLNTNGGDTTYAPPSALLPLSAASNAAGSFNTFSGSGTSSNKSVTYTISGLDTSYDVIEHIAILYNGSNVNIFKFAEDSIPATGELSVICSSLSGAEIITPEEYSIIDSGFSKCKDIEVQGNRLVAANISTTRADLDFDARAYRFNTAADQYAPEAPYYPFTSAPTAPTALLRDSNDNTLDIALYGGSLTPAWDSVPEEHDCINIFNKEQESLWTATDRQYKYKVDGTTLGGEGKNISYEFVEKDTIGNTAFDDLTTAPEHIQVPSYNSSTASITKNVLNADGTTQPVHIHNQVNSMAAPWAHSNYTGYARGEVYRFGIVFYDLKGVVSFVKWIGDIKFPDVEDGYPLQDASGNTVSLHQLGIEFDVDVSSIASQISGYSIVRLNREDVDKTKLGTGFFGYFNVQINGNTDSLMHRYFNSGLGGGAGSNDPFKVAAYYQAYGTDDTNGMMLSDRPGETFLMRNEDVYARIGYMVSPFGRMYTSAHTDNDYIQTLEYYSAQLSAYYSAITGTSAAEATDADFAFSYKMRTRVADTGGGVRLQVDKAKDLGIGQVVLATDDFMSDLDTGGGANQANLVNGSYCRDSQPLISDSREQYPLGIGGAKRVLKLRTTASAAGTTVLTPSINHMSTSMGWNGVAGYYGPDTVGDVTLDFNGDHLSDQEVLFKSIGYRRYLDLQYKGDTYESRSTNEYLYIGHFQTTAHVNSHSLAFEVFGGDTYVNYYDEEYIERYNSAALQNVEEIFKDPSINKLGIAICGPVESAVNTNWRDNNLWAKDRAEADMNGFSVTGASIEPIWNVDDEIQAQFFAEDFLSSLVEEHPTQLWASDVKINGELADSWRSFPLTHKTEVDGIYGPINRIRSFKDNLMFYQDRAFGIASLDEKSVIQDDSGQELVLGTGGVFPTYQYMSTNSGTIHQFSVVDTENAIYHYDARLKKFMKFAGGVEPVSDLKGMSSFFAEEVTGSITATDKTLRAATPVGVHGVYDPRYNRVLYTFLSGNENKGINEYEDKDGNFVFPAGSYILVGGITYFCEDGLTIPATVPATTPDISEMEEFIVKSTAFTIGYSEVLQAFESFYAYHPGMYLEYGRRMFSVSPFENENLYQHNVGLPGQYYDNIDSISRIHTVFSQPGDVNKVWNNLGYMSELYDTNDVDVYNETMDRMHFKTNYQDTGMVTLIPDTNIKRRMRTWRTAIPREVDKELSRMRNPWLECILEYDNSGGKRHVLHDLIYSFTPAKM